MDGQGFTLICLLNTAVFLLGNLLPAAGAYSFAKVITRGLLYRFAAATALYFLQTAAIFSLLGVFGFLSLPAGLICGAVTGLSLTILSNHLTGTEHSGPQVPENPICRTTTFFLFLTFLIFLYQSTRASNLPGTDTYLYHLYYPAMWIMEGKIFSIPLIGLPHEYFPVCGETLYGWLMLTGNDTPFLPLLQLSALIMLLLSIAGMWRKYNIPALYCAAGTFLFFLQSVVFQNVYLCYTDTLTGSLLGSGLCFLIPALDLKCHEKREQNSFAILGGILLGMAAATKYGGLILAPTLTLMFLIYFFFKRQESRKTGLIAAACAILTAGVYYLPNWIKTGNPFYPVRIPLLFPQGIEFNIAPVALEKLWSFYVTDNCWDMNIATACLLLLLFAAGAVLCLTGWNKKQERDLIRLLGVMLLFFAAGGILFSVIHPRTQARQIVPFLCSAFILIPPVLYLMTNRFCQTGKGKVLFSALICLLALISFNTAWDIYFICGYILFIVLALLLAIPRDPRWLKLEIWILIPVTFAILVYHSLFFLTCTMNFFYTFGGETAYQCASHLRREFRHEQPFRIASAGSWYNYMLMLHLPGLKVEHVPINIKNTASPHKLKDLRELREPVPFEVWMERLKQGGYTHLIVDLQAYQDFPDKRDLELKWAQAHPEHFEMITADGKIWFFRIREEHL